MKRNNKVLNDFVSNQIGASYQNYLTDTVSDYKALSGKQINRYGLKDKVKGHISKEHLNEQSGFIKDNPVFVQNIVSHIMNPQPHIKIIATILDNKEKDNYVVINTVNQLNVVANLNNKFILALLNSKLLSWYVYRFIFANAVRTMHFDNPVTSRIPIPDATSAATAYNILSGKQKQCYANTLTLEQEIDELVYGLYGLSKKEIALVEGKES